MPPTAALQPFDDPGGLVFRKFVSFAIFACALALLAAPAGAQRARNNRFREASLSISPYAGYMTFGQLADGPLNTSLKSAAAPVYGLQLNLPLGASLSIVGNVAYTEPDLSVGIPILGDISFDPKGDIKQPGFVPYIWKNTGGKITYVELKQGT